MIVLTGMCGEMGIMHVLDLFQGATAQSIPTRLYVRPVKELRTE